MNKLDLVCKDNLTFRILEIESDKALVVNCNFLRVPKWIPLKDLLNFSLIKENDFFKERGIQFRPYECYNIQERAKMHKIYASFCPVLASIGDERDRGETIAHLSKISGLNRKTIIRRLYAFLVYQDIRIFIHDKRNCKKELTQDEKNFRYILNKYFYSREKRTLKNCYLYLLREKYSKKGSIISNHPTINQFRYFYYKTRKLNTFYISREGKSEFDRNIRPLLGNSTNAFNIVGYGMVDNTTLDLYVLDENGKPRRPILSAMVDAYSHLCLGFALSFQAGEKLLRKLLENVNNNKVEYCNSLGILIDEKDYPCEGLPQTIITDNGSDYSGSSFTQLIELGITIQTNKSHYPHMKPHIERFFGVIQNIFKPYLNKFGVVNKNNYPESPQENSVLNLKDVEIIICKCIIHYNSKKVQNLPYGKEYLSPHANSIFLDSYSRYPDTFIKVSDELLKITMMKRGTGKFTRFGLKFGKFYYRAFGFTNEFLAGKESIIVAYDECDISKIYGKSRGFWFQFAIIDEFFKNKTLFEAEEVLRANTSKKKEFQLEEHLSEIGLAKSIENVIGCKGDKNEHQR